MAEILTESFCERCGTRYTFETVQPKRRALGAIGTFGRGLKNFVVMTDSSFDEAMAVARSEDEQKAANAQLEAFHRTFNFCLSCRQYTCADCWNAVEGRCLTCAPLPEPEVIEPEEVQLQVVAPEVVAPEGVQLPAEPAGVQLPAEPAGVQLPAEPAGVQLPAEPERARPVSPPPISPASAQVLDTAEVPTPEMPALEMPAPVVQNLATVVESPATVVETPEPVEVEARPPHPGPADLPALETPAAFESEAATEPEATVAPEAPGVPNEEATLKALLAAAREARRVADLEPDAPINAPEAAVAPEPLSTVAAPPSGPARAPSFPGFQPGHSLDEEIAAYELRVAALAETPPAPGPPIVVAATPPPAPAASRLARPAALAAAPNLPAPTPMPAAPGSPGTCRSCGLSISASARFCRRCGTAQQVA
jgi:hypothetical protein